MYQPILPIALYENIDHLVHTQASLPVQHHLNCVQHLLNLFIPDLKSKVEEYEEKVFLPATTLWQISGLRTLRITFGT